MDRTTLRRPMALFASAALLGSLAVVTTTAPVVAQVPTCDGQPATITDNDGTDADPTVGGIVGTDGPDVIVGSDLNDVIFGLGGDDIICGGRGDDGIDGGDGRDRIFGGSGDDLIKGGAGSDDLFGFAGDDDIDGGPGRDFVKGGGGRDTIRGGGGDDILQGNDGPDRLLGQAGNDRLDGGTGIDNCQQGAGSGPVRNCERADLKVTVLCPSSAPEGPLTCRVRVKNLGPSRTAYSLETRDNQSKGGNSVDCTNNWETAESFGRLRPGGVRTIERTANDCAILSQPAVVWFRATIVTTEARDPRPANNEDDDSTSLN